MDTIKPEHYSIKEFETKKLPYMDSKYIKAWKVICSNNILNNDVLEYIQSKNCDSMAIYKDKDKPKALENIYPREIKDIIITIKLMYDFINLISGPVQQHVLEDRSDLEFKALEEYLGYKLIFAPPVCTRVMELDPKFKRNDMEPIHVKGNIYIKDLRSFLKKMCITRWSKYGYYTTKSLYAAHLKTFYYKNPADGKKSLSVYYTDKQLAIEDFKQCYLDFLKSSESGDR